MLEPFEIQADGECQTLQDDEVAVRKHATDCGCDWPPIDYANRLSRWLGWLEQSYYTETVGKLEELVSNREDFVKNLDQMLLLIGQCIDESMSVYLDTYEWGYIQNIATNLLRLKSQVANKTFNPTWFFCVDDGVFLENGGWRTV
jgi:hypothetical protein